MPNQPVPNQPVPNLPPTLPSSATTTRRRWLKVVVPAALGLGVFGCKKEEFKCDDVAGLTPADIEARKALQYKDHSDTPEHACKNCAQYVEPEGSGCATCRVMRGPVHPEGSCKVFASKV